MIKFFFIGILFGIRFQSFHMYGIIGTAVILGAMVVFISKKTGWKTVEGKLPDFTPKKMEFKRLLFGGILFGFGWAMTGACPGPLYALLGHGVWVISVVILSGIFGAYMYGVLRPRLPH
jgi:uncharacterized membrane protein YedE/YeeE